MSAFADRGDEDLATYVCVIRFARRQDRRALPFSEASRLIFRIIAAFGCRSGRQSRGWLSRPERSVVPARPSGIWNIIGIGRICFGRRFGPVCWIGLCRGHRFWKCRSAIRPRRRIGWSLLGAGGKPDGNDGGDQNNRASHDLSRISAMVPLVARAPGQ
jgi:hypothetical protein